MRRPVAHRAVGPAALPLVAVALALVALVAPAPAVRRLAAQAPPQADSRPTVAVMYFTNGSIFQHETFGPLSTGITELLIHELSQNDSIRVVEREQLQKVMAEIGLAASDRVDQATAARVGRLVGAQHVIVGGFVVDPRGRTMAITARADHTETGVVASSQKVEGKPDDALKLVAELGRRLNTRMRLPPMPERPAPPGGGAGRFDAVVLYSRALVAQDRGDLQQAAALFREALARYPEYPQARAALARLERSE
jgi:TolB-like protein